MRKGGRRWSKRGGGPVARGDRARAKGKIEEKRDPRAFNPRKRNSSWIHFERKRAFCGAQRIGILFTLMWWVGGGAGVHRGVGFGVVNWKERGLPRIRPGDKGMTTVVRSSWQSQTSDPFLPLLLSFFMQWLKSARPNENERMSACESRWPIVHIHGAFCLSRDSSCCAARSLRGKLLRLDATTTDENSLIEASRSLFCFIADLKVGVSEFTTNFAIVDSNSPRQLWCLNLESLEQMWVRTLVSGFETL